MAFSYAQTGGLGWALIARRRGAARAASRQSARHARAIWQGYRRGKAAAWLPGEDYEQLMAEPLDAARRRLNITPADASTTPSRPLLASGSSWSPPGPIRSFRLSTWPAVRRA